MPDPIYSEQKGLYSRQANNIAKTRNNSIKFISIRTLCTLFGLGRVSSSQLPVRETALRPVSSRHSSTNPVTFRPHRTATNERGKCSSNQTELSLNLFPSRNNFPAFQQTLCGASKQSLERHTRDPQSPAGESSAAPNTKDQTRSLRITSQLVDLAHRIPLSSLESQGGNLSYRNRFQ